MILVIIAGVMLAVAMAKMKNLLDEEEFECFYEPI